MGDRAASGRLGVDRSTQRGVYLARASMSLLRVLLRLRSDEQIDDALKRGSVFELRRQPLLVASATNLVDD
jgi:hypothetical protein